MMTPPSIVDRGSSPVDWCEANYRVHPDIAEFANTVTNLVFILLSPVFCFLYRDYARTINRGIYLIWILFAVVGLSSMYFHATLSLLGQMLDELAILWLFAASFALWMPTKNLPRFLKHNRQQFQRSVFLLSLIFTALAWVYPWINAFVLVAMGVPCFILLFFEVQRNGDERSTRLSLQCSTSWIVSMTCWLSDRMFCDQWQQLGLDYLHALFHVTIAYTSFSLCSLFALFYAIHEMPARKPVISFWPSDSWHWGLPYIKFTRDCDERDKDKRTY